MGENDRNPNLIGDFREALIECDLMDIWYTRYPFTWGNGRYRTGFVEERLDRFLCNNAWSENFVDYAAINLESWTFDHCPVLMEVQNWGNGLRHNRKRSSHIYYEDIWSSYDVCKEIIEDVWSRQRSWNRDNLTQEFYKMTKESMAMLIFLE